MPLPRVTYPTMPSPRIGLQHFARYTSRSSTPFRRLCLYRVRGQFLQHPARREFAVAQCRVQILRLAAAVFASHALQIRLGDLGQLHAEPPSLALQVLLPDLDGLGMLGGIDQV